MADVAAPSPVPSSFARSPAISPLPTHSQTPEKEQSHSSTRSRRESARTPLHLQGERTSTVSLREAARTESRASTKNMTLPLFTSSLDYCNVRDFAYTQDDSRHYGIPAVPSGATTPASEYYGARRLSDPMEALRNNSSGRYSAGQWGGDGVIYGDPDGDMEPLPSTSFGSNEQFGDDTDASGRKGKHRKSKSYTEVSDYERGRHNRRSKDPDYFRYSNSQYDPAGREGLRYSRGFAADGSSHRRDSHLQRNAAAAAANSNNISGNGYFPPDERMPLDEEISSLHATSPSRDSMGPEDESVRGQALALYDFEPENPNELRLREGQTVMVAYRNGHGWLVAEDPHTGEQGLVPEEYVRLVRDIEGWDPERGGFIEEVDNEDTTQDESGSFGDLTTQSSVDVSGSVHSKEGS